VHVTGTAQQQAWRAQTLPPVEQVRPDLWSVPVPIPGNPLRYTLTYLVAAGSGLLVVDPGWDSEPGWRALVSGLATLGATCADVTGIVVTHAHPDHHGMSSRLCAASGAWVGMHPVERETLPRRQWSGRRGRQADRAWLASCGVPADVAAELSVPPQDADVFLAMPEPDVLLEDHDLVPLPGRRLRAVWTPGHTPGHLCFHEETENLLLTGDHVLPRITPNIGLQPPGAGIPLALYLRSLSRICAYDEAEALPAHEYRFRGLAGRARVLQAHHEQRCEEVTTILDQLGTATVWEVTERMSWSRGWQAVTGIIRRAAIGEAEAHLRYLVGQERVTRISAEETPTRYSAPRHRGRPGPCRAIADDNRLI
jgi:glyoxylase-like metal-dependent hydrolase (beta-lactamase superfamily II)